MRIRPTLLRGAAVLAVAAAMVGTTLSAPVASAAPFQRVNGNDNEASDGGGIGDVPVIGDLVGSFEGQEPEEIADGAIDLAAGAAHIVVPTIIQLFK
ncbi:MAG: hypothetical protein AB7P40_25140 [Chloroflexota bacterium]